MQQLTAEKDDLVSTVETLKTELIASHEDASRASDERDAMRSRALHENAQESLLRERELREVQGTLERCRMERDEWEDAALKERVAAEEVRGGAELLRRELEWEREARERETGELGVERERAQNLQAVLEDFQAGMLPLFMIFLKSVRDVLLICPMTAKEHELRQAVKDYESRLMTVTQSLAEYKHRALTAEVSRCFLITSMRIATMMIYL